MGWNKLGGDSPNGATFERTLVVVLIYFVPPALAFIIGVFLGWADNIQGQPWWIALGDLLSPSHRKEKVVYGLAVGCVVMLLGPLWVVLLLAITLARFRMRLPSIVRKVLFWHPAYVTCLSLGVFSPLCFLVPYIAFA